jgi:glycosyltransferase involved in cell wall biosynthesis
MKGARFVVFPSEWYENLPLVVIEAFSCGVPVIASRLGAMEELVEHGHTGLLFRPGDVNDLARTMEVAWERPEYLERIGAQGRLEYEAKYTAAANYQQLIKIYEDVIANRAGTSEPVQEAVQLPVA